MCCYSNEIDETLITDFSNAVLSLRHFLKVYVGAYHYNENTIAASDFDYKTIVQDPRFAGNTISIDILRAVSEISSCDQTGDTKNPVFKFKLGMTSKELTNSYFRRWFDDSRTSPKTKQYLENIVIKACMLRVANATKHDYNTCIHRLTVI